MTHMFLAQEVARQYGIVIASCDRHTVQQSIRNRVLANKKMADLIGNTGEVALGAEPPDLQCVDDDVIATKGNSKRHFAGACSIPYLS